MKLTTTLKKLSLAILVTAAATACSVKGGGGSGGDAAASISAAEAAIAKAKANKWIWRDTEKFLKKAKEADKKGDSTTAVKLANKAKFQADQAVAQYLYEKTQDRSKYIK